MAAPRATLTPDKQALKRTVAGWPLAAGLQYHPFRIASFASNTAGCTIGMLF